MSDIETVAKAAIRRIVAMGYSIDFADLMVTTVLSELDDPDREMIEAGLEELTLQLGPVTDKQHGRAYRRQLVQVIWHAMLDRAR